MKSPFPGMDPYLERHWRDVHATVITLAKGQLNRVLPEELVARVEERVVIDPDHSGRARAIYPDVRVYEDPADLSGSQSVLASGATVAEPIILQLTAEEHTEPYITVLDADGGELVTVIEVLSRTNKVPGNGRDDYLKKRAELLDAHVNVLEIDLLRAGRWRDLLRPLVAPANADSSYRVVSWRQHPVRQVELYPISLRRRLPVIPIPLRDQDADVKLDLQSLLDITYIESRYSRLRYSEPCEPPLEDSDAQWAEGLIRSAASK